MKKVNDIKSEMLESLIEMLSGMEDPLMPKMEESEDDESEDEDKKKKKMSMMVALSAKPKE
jgi:hypothetical protein